MTLLTSVCNDKYVPGMLIFLHSFQRHNPDWKFRFKIYHRDDLGDASKELLLSVHNGLEFEEVTDPLFLGTYAQYMCLLPFKETDQEKVIFLDCDMLCLGNIDGLLDTKKDFAACLDMELFFPRRKSMLSTPLPLRWMAYFSTGVFAIKGGCLSEDLYKKLTSKIEQNIVDRENNKKKLWDQDIINDVLRFHDSEILPFTYNARKNLFKKGVEPENVGTKIVHYTGGSKPWYKEGSDFLPLKGKYARYKHLHKLWHAERELFIKNHGFDPMDYAFPLEKQMV